MKKDFDVKSFVEEYEKQLTDLEKSSFFKNKLKVEKYLPYSEKLVIAENIVESSSYAMIKENDVLKKTSRIEINSPMRYILFVMTIVNKYTNITVNFNDILPEFDYLNKNSLIEAIFNKIGEKEVNEFNTVVEMVLNDFMASKYEFKNYISEILSKLYIMVERGYPLVDNIINKLDNLTEEDAEKLSGLLSKLKIFAK